MLREDSNKEPIVKIDKMDDYKVINPTEEEKEKAADEQGVNTEIVKKGSESDKDTGSKDAGSKDAALKNFIAAILDDIKEFIKSI